MIEPDREIVFRGDFLCGEAESADIAAGPVDNDVFGGVDALSKIYSAATALLVKSEIDFDSRIAFKLQCLVSVSVQIVKMEA